MKMPNKDKRASIPAGVRLLGPEWDPALVGYAGKAGVYSASALRRLVRDTGIPNPMAAYVGVREALLQSGCALFNRVGRGAMPALKAKYGLEETHSYLREALIGVVEGPGTVVRLGYNRRLCKEIMRQNMDVSTAGGVTEKAAEAELLRIEGYMEAGLAVVTMVEPVGCDDDQLPFG